MSDSRDAGGAAGIWRFRGDLIAAAMVAVLLATGAAMVVVTRQPGPVDVVRDFLAAVQRRDIGEALQIAGADRPTGEHRRFISADALDGDWQVVDVTEVEQRRELPTYRLVHVTLPAARKADQDGERDGRPVQVAQYELTRKSDDDPWRIADPFTKVRFSSSPLWYLAVSRGGCVSRVQYSVEFLAWFESPKSQAWPSVELVRHCIQIRLTVD